MKKMRFLTLLTSLLLCGTLAAQVPQAFDFQAVARDASGNVLSGQSVSVRLTVHSGSAGGAIAYQETHAVTTNAFGLFSVAVGQGSAVQGVFTGVSWSAASHYLQVELDASGGSNYVDMGTTQLLSVPYALHAGGVECASVSLLGDTLRQANGCYVIIPGVSAANGGCADADNDGFYNNAGCPPLDCNDANALVNPGATELCGNGTDDDCDGTPDNNTDPQAFVLFYADADADGFGDPAISNSACAQPVGYVTNNDDCDDGDASVFPGQNCSQVCSATEVAWLDANFQSYTEGLMSAFSNCLFTNDPAACMLSQLAGQFPLSDDCNACGVDWANCVRTNCLAACVQGPEACTACMNSAGCNANMMECFGLTDADGDGWPAGSDCDDANAATYTGAPEICDGQDNDCNGIVDDQLNFFADVDEDGFGDPNAPVPCTGIGVPNSGDCDDNDPQVTTANTYYLDADGDGFGEPQSGFSSCTPPAGAVTNDSDCNDADANAHPGSTTGWNCVGCAPAAQLYMAQNQYVGGSYPQFINDFGAACEGGLEFGILQCLYMSQPDLFLNIPLEGACMECFLAYWECSGAECMLSCDNGEDGSQLCFECLRTSACGQAFMACSGLTDADGDGVFTQNDCDDNNATNGAGMAEACDGVDNNCNGQADEGFQNGDPCEHPDPCVLSAEIQNCTCVALGFSPDSDGDGACDAVDDCDGDPSIIDAPLWYFDGDGDGFGGTGFQFAFCVQPFPGTVLLNGDCDDNDPLSNPNATEVCGDGIDNNCNGQIDENCGPQELCDGLDNDGNGQIDEGLGLGQACGCGGVVICDGQGGTTCSQPGLPETCNGIDDDCDGLVDEGGVCGCAPAGTPCDDGNACTVNDVEDGACTCISGSAAVCDDGNPCTIDTCDPVSGCVHIPAPAGTACDDGNPNTINDVCNGAGMCIGTVVANEVCDGLDNDGDGLTDAADPGLVLVMCENQIGVCNGVQKTSNLCVGGTWTTCSLSEYAAGSPVFEATETSCDTQDNDCDGLVDEDNVCDPCSAPNICTISGQCYANGETNPGSPCLVCNTVLSTTSWSFKPVGSTCGTGNGCSNFTCNGAGICVQTFSSAGTPCNDGNPNTTNDVCNGAGNCTGTPCPDADADGFSTCQGDCNDSNLNINPARPELCNGVDDNCNGQVDEGGVCPPAAPVITGSTPLSPSNNSTPTVMGTASDGSTVRFYASNTCQGAPVAQTIPVSGGFFGHPVPVGPNTTTVITARATSAGGLVSTCSSAISYAHDDTAPATPAILASTPLSPGNSISPTLSGTAEPFSTVNIRTTANCLGAVLATGTAAGDGTFSIVVMVASNSSSTFHAQAVDDAGNSSGCSSGFAYTHIP